MFKQTINMNLVILHIYRIYSTYIRKHNTQNKQLLPVPFVASRAAQHISPRDSCRVVLCPDYVQIIGRLVFSVAPHVNRHLPYSHSKTLFTIILYIYVYLLKHIRRFFFVCFVWLAEEREPGPAEHAAGFVRYFLFCFGCFHPELFTVDIWKIKIKTTISLPSVLR